MSKQVPQKRFFGLDVHKAYIMVAAVNADKEVVLKPRRVTFAHFETWMNKTLRSTDEVVLEATTNAWHVHDLLAPKVAKVLVAHPYHVKLIAAAAVKTDKRDALALAKLLSANMIPPVWVPPQHVRDLRAIIAHRNRLVSQRTAAKNRMHSVLHRHNLLQPQGDPFSPDNQAWWDALKLPASEKLRLKQDMSIINYLCPLIDETEDELKRLSTSPHWAPLLPFLLQITGVGLVSAMTILSAIGDIHRFPSAKKLVGYAGLGGRIRSSGGKHRTGSITKQGRTELRATAVEISWTAVKFNPHWKAEFDRLKVRIGDKKAIVAIARKILVSIWHILTHRQADIHATEDKVAYKLLLYTWQLGTQHRPDDYSAPLLTRYFLNQLDLGHNLETIYPGGVKRLIPPTRDLEALPPPFADR
jgi:transposase